MDYEKWFREHERKAPPPEEWMRLVPQEAVKRADFPKDAAHNAIWDYNVSPEGRHFMSLCAECTYADYFHLFEYLPAENRVRRLFRLEDRAVTYDRCIRPSKVHTSITFMPDGKLIMSTHTTAMAPSHPYWLPYSFYSHPWEGYHGSNILIYDPVNDKLEDLGIPVPRESIYSGVYVAETNSFYFAGYMRGHLYRFCLDDRSVKDYGQWTEQSTYYTKQYRDGNVYVCSRTGLFSRINVKEDRVEPLGFFPETGLDDRTHWHNQISYAKDGPDGRMYIGPVFDRDLLVWDYDTKTISRVGSILPPALESLGTNRTGSIYGMAFDEEGVLWYGLTTSCAEYGGGFYLVSWDLLHGGVPQNHGLMGTQPGLTGVLSEMYIRDGILYATNTNYRDNTPCMFRVDLSLIRGRGPEGPVTEDTLFWLEHTGSEKYVDQTHLFEDTKRYGDYEETWKVNNRVIDENDPRAVLPGGARIVKPWRYIEPGESAVQSVRYDPDGTIRAVCGKTVFRECTLTRDGQVRFAPCTAPVTDDAWKARYADVKLPAWPGRQFRAKASAEAVLPDGRRLVGTEDGFLALVDGERVQSLGMTCVGGPVHSIAVSPDGSFAVGAAGDPEDLGMLFMWKEAEGLILLGRCSMMNVRKGGDAGYSSEPVSVAVSPDGKRFAVGCRDNLGVLYEFGLAEGEIEPLTKPRW